MIGCHRTSNDTEFRDFGRPQSTFDELSIWTRKLEVNRTHNEVLYFTAGYGEMFYNIQQCASAMIQTKIYKNTFISTY